MELSHREDDSMLLYEKNRNTLTVRLVGDLDHREAARLRSELDGLIEQTNAKRLVFDMNDLVFMDSSGIGFIIGRYKLMSKRSGTVAITGPDARIDRIFEMSGIYQIVERLA